jgi:transcriptional regulator with PAS, ATPase and Fis domain
MNYKWEGNVRELKGLITNIVVSRHISENSQPIELSDLPEHFVHPVGHEKIDSKPKKGRKRRPSDEELIRLKNEGLTQEEVAKKFGVVRETVNRWYADIKKRQNQQNQSLKN